MTDPDMPNPGDTRALAPHQAERLERLVLAHLDAASNLARHLLREPHDAEDAVQDAVLRAIRHFDGFRGGDGRAWLLAIVRNTCYTRLKRDPSRRGDAEFDEELHGSADPSAEPPARYERDATAATLERAVAGLPPEFREVLVLREFEEMSYREIAQVVGVPIGTVMSRLSRARERLQRAWTGRAGVEG